MGDRGPRRRARADRRRRPRLEGLDRRELLAAAGFSHSLGPYVGGSPAGPRLQQPAGGVDPHSALAAILPTILGPELRAIQAVNQARVSPHRRVLAESVLSRPFVHAVLGEPSTYHLLQSPALSGLIGSEVVSTGPTVATQPTVSPAEQARLAALAIAGTSPFEETIPTAGNVPVTIGAPVPVAPVVAATTAATSAEPQVVFSVPDQATVVSLGDPTSLVQVNPVGTVPGFFVNVPTTNIRILELGPPTTGSLAVPVADLPAGFPVPEASTIPVGTFAATYASTGPLLTEMLNAGLPRVAPNAPADVPGLRLVPFLTRSRVFPNPGVQASFRRMLRLAAQRDVFTLNASQGQALQEGLQAFADQVNALTQAGAFDQAVPPPAPSLPTGPLSGTFAVSAGVLRRLASVDPSVSGLSVPGLGNFPGRLDVGYVFDRSGNFGILLTARGPLAGAQPDQNAADTAGGDLRVEVTDAPSLAALTGLRATEGVFVGPITSAELGSSRYASGVSAFSASVGDGLGLEYGTGVSYSQVIPLGNVFSLIPSAPRGG